MQNKWYHIGIRGNILKGTLADANENRDWHIYFYDNGLDTTTPIGRLYSILIVKYI